MPTVRQSIGRATSGFVSTLSVDLPSPALNGNKLIIASLSETTTQAIGAPTVDSEATTSLWSGRTNDSARVSVYTCTGGEETITVTTGGAERIALMVIEVADLGDLDYISENWGDDFDSNGGNTEHEGAYPAGSTPRLALAFAY